MKRVLGIPSNTVGRNRGFPSIFIHKPSHVPIVQSLIGIDIHRRGSSSKVVVVQVFDVLDGRYSESICPGVRSATPYQVTRSAEWIREVYGSINHGSK